MDKDGEWLMWKPLSLLKPEKAIKTALLILNQPFQYNWMDHFWKHASLHVAVDGGANHLHAATKKYDDKFIPDLITGDFDSIADDVLQFYKDKGSIIINTPDQDHTDFTKALQETVKYIEAVEGHPSVNAIIAMCSNGGRTDQIFANYQTLCLANSMTDIPVFLFSGDSLSWMMKKGKHCIKLENNSFHETWCGLIPLGEPCCHVTTSGLKWNLDDASLFFGGLVSTSNTFAGSEEVTITTDQRLLWTMAAPSLSWDTQNFSLRTS